MINVLEPVTLFFIGVGLFLCFLKKNYRIIILVGGNYNNRFLIIAIICFSFISLQADTITNADFESAPSLSMPSGWYNSDLGPSGLFDGITANPGNGRVVFYQGSAVLSRTNYISIGVDLKNSWVINSFQVANDFGGGTTHEMTAIDLIFSGDNGLIKDFSFSGIEDNIIDDIDDIFVNENITGVTNIEFRITGNDTSTAIELREFIMTGTRIIPEPSGILLFIIFISLLFTKKYIL